MKTKARFHELDLLRFLAACSVLLFHYSFRGHAQGGYSPVSYPALAVVFKYGYLGVNLFFIISGFVILISARGKDAFQFSVSRICRLYPAFWAGATITVLGALLFHIQRFIVDPRHYLMNLSMISGYFGVPLIDGVYWTLLIEIKFYFLVFLLLLVRKINHLEAFLWVWIGISAIGALWPLPFHLDFFLIPSWSCYFIAGATFYLISGQGLRYHRVLLLLLSFLFCLWEAFSNAAGMDSYYHQHFSNLIIFFVLLGFFALFFLVSLNKFDLSSSKRLLTLSALTYPLYLIHQNLGYMFFQDFHNDLNAGLLLVLVSGFMLLCAFLVYRFVERPLSSYMKSRLYSMKNWVFRSSADPNV